MRSSSFVLVPLAILVVSLPVYGAPVHTRTGDGIDILKPGELPGREFNELLARKFKLSPGLGKKIGGAAAGGAGNVVGEGVVGGAIDEFSGSGQNQTRRDVHGLTARKLKLSSGVKSAGKSALSGLGSSLFENGLGALASANLTRRGVDQDLQARTMDDLMVLSRAFVARSLFGDLGDIFGDFEGPVESVLGDFLGGGGSEATPSEATSSANQTRRGIDDSDYIRTLSRELVARSLFSSLGSIFGDIEGPLSSIIGDATSSGQGNQDSQDSL